MPKSFDKKKKGVKTVDELVKETHFSKLEIEKLIELYKSLRTSKIDRLRFREIIHDFFQVTDDFLSDRMYKVFNKQNDGNLSSEEWVLGMSVLLRGNQDEQITFCFNVYDFNQDGFISREEVYLLLKSSIVTQVSRDEDVDDAVKELVELVVRKLDSDGDQKISLKDMITAISNEPLLMQCLGPCLPTKQAAKSFEDKHLYIEVKKKFH